MTNPVVRGLTAIGRFSGRDSPGQFWPYAGTSVALVFALAMVAMPIALQGILADLHIFAMAHPDAATIERSPNSYSISIDAGHPDAPQLDFQSFFMVVAAMAGALVILLAAAVSRRLHDCNRPAFFGLIPVVFLGGGLTLFPLMMQDFMTSQEPDLRLFGAVLLNNLLYLASLAALIVQCAWRGTPGPNRYGEEPAR